MRKLAHCSQGRGLHHGRPETQGAHTRQAAGWRSEKAGALGAVPTRREPLRGTNVPGPGLASSARLHMPNPHRGRQKNCPHVPHLRHIAAHMPLVAQGHQHATAGAAGNKGPWMLSCRAPRLVGRPVSVCAGLAGSARDVRGS